MTQHFLEWINENLEPFFVFEKKEPVQRTELPGKRRTLVKYQNYLNELGILLGVNGTIPEENEAVDLILNNNFPGFFWRGDDLVLVSTTPKKKNHLPQAEMAIATIKKRKLKVEDAQDHIILTLKDGMKVNIRYTSKGIDVNEGETDPITERYLTDTTGVQESITAAVLNVMAHNEAVDGKLSDSLKAYINNPRKLKALEKDDKETKFVRWLLSSNPKKGTGICQYLDLGGKDDPDYFQKELYKFLDGSWLKHYRNLYNSKVIDEISKVFKNGFNMSQAQFLHFYVKGFGVSSPLGQYLREGRAGYKNKDVLDKADIILCTNIDRANRAIDDLMHNYKDNKTYCKAVNRYINNKVLIGISLKQTKSAVNVSAVNFKIFTTATGDNINDDMKVIVKYYKKGDKNNTFDFAGSELSQAKDGNSCTILTPIKNGHDIHTEEKELLSRIGSNSSRFGSIMAEFGIKNYPAQLGKYTEALKDKYGLSISEELNALVDRSSSEAEIKRAYYRVAQKVLAIMKAHPQEMNKIFAIGAGYPIQFGPDQEPEIDSAPYIKIY